MLCMYDVRVYNTWEFGLMDKCCWGERKKDVAKFRAEDMCVFDMRCRSGGISLYTN